MNKKKVPLVGTVSIILIIVVIALFSNSSLNPPLASARITDLSVEWTPFPTVVGVTSVSTFNITVQNNGTVELSGLILSIERMTDDNRTNPDGYSYQNDGDYNFSLSIAESKTINVYIIADMIKTMEYRDTHQNFLATLTCNGTILDEHKLYEP
jgi:hypothetical protein